MLFKRTVAVLMSAALMVPFALSAHATDDTYVIKSPYEEVNWDTWKAYKGNLHTHSTISDADETMIDMATEAYNQNFDFLAFSEHGVTGKAWNVKPVLRPFYFYQILTGHVQNWLSDEQYEGMTTGTYSLNSTGEARGTGMTCVTGANELNAVTASKSHVNGYFLPEDVGNSNWGFENGYEYAIKMVEKVGGLSHINHPGDWIEGDGESKVSNPDTVEFFARLLLKYQSCLGLEVFNGSNNTTRYDRILWDNLLMSVLPYGRTVIGFSNSDAHTTDMIDSTFSVFMMDTNNVANIKKTMQSGAFFGVTRNVKSTEKLGPAADYNVTNQGLAYPMFTNIDVSGHKITVKAENYTHIQWIANGEVIYEKDVTEAEQGNEVMLDLDSIPGNEDFLYVRAELLGPGGECFSQAFVIDDGSTPLQYEEKVTFQSVVDQIIFTLKSTRVYVYAMEIIKLIDRKIINK